MFILGPGPVTTPQEPVEGAEEEPLKDRVDNHDDSRLDNDLASLAVPLFAEVSLTSGFVEYLAKVRLFSLYYFNRRHVVKRNLDGCVEELQREHQYHDNCRFATHRTKLKPLNQKRAHQSEHKIE